MDHRWISSLEIWNLRNLGHVKLAAGPRVNVIVGPNGSGKSSILEGIHLLGVGRSFLTRQASTYIQHGTDRTTIFGRVEISPGVSAKIGVERDGEGHSEVRVNGERAQGYAAVAAILPVLLMTPESHRIIGGGPAERRSIVDWGLFHVEQGFLDLWRRYHRALKQRNAALSSGGPLSPWDDALCDAGEALSNRRGRYVEELEILVKEYVAALAPELEGICVDYLQGWPVERRLAESLVESAERDRRDGFTHLGPHRSELRLRLKGRRAAHVLSRGQEKVVLSAIRLAQAKHLEIRAQKQAVVLIDDLPAELDNVHSERFAAILESLGVQVFVTATDPGLLPRFSSKPETFHVEHGHVGGMV